MTDYDAGTGTDLSGLEDKTLGCIGTEDFQTVYLCVGNNCIVRGTCTTKYINNAGKTVYAFYAVIATTEKHVHGNEYAVNESYTVATTAAFLDNGYVCFYSSLNKAPAYGALCIATYAGNVPCSSITLHGSAAVRYICRRYGREYRAVLHPYRLT